MGMEIAVLRYLAHFLCVCRRNTQAMCFSVACTNAGTCVQDEMSGGMQGERAGCTGFALNKV
jgi:hypothetical protein